MQSNDFVPGTVQLVDVGQDDAVAEIVLHPRPSKDPEDPLNWSYRRKMLSTFCMFTYVLPLNTGNFWITEFQICYDYRHLLRRNLFRP